MKKEEFYFDSRDNESKIHAVKWIPDKKPVCIVQIVHGMAEYVERYEEFAEFLVGKNILVTGEDHLGHGKSMGNNPPGYFCKKDPATVVVRDVHRLKKLVQEEYPGIPYFIFGHSMGSLITRNYMGVYGRGIDGAVICGTGMPKKTLMYVTGVLTGILKVFQGAKHPSRFLDTLGFGSYCKRIENATDSFDWLSVNRENVKKYKEDPMCGFLFTVNGFETLKELSLRLYNTNMLGQIPRELPVLFLYGKGDPVGEYGEAVQAVYRSYQEMGMKDTAIKEYQNDRHEILNEDDRKQVMEDVVCWIMKRIGI